MKRILFPALVLFFVFPLIAQRTTPSFQKHVIDNNVRMAKKLYPIDIDNDGDIDIAVVASNTTADTANVMWFENDGAKNFLFHSISDTFYTGRAIWAADVTGDGNIDIIAGGTENSVLTLFVNDGTPTIGSWQKKELYIPDSTIYSINTADVDGDSDIDIIASFGNEDNDLGGDIVRIFYNNGDTTFTVDTLVENYEGACSVFIDDFNNDGDPDILTGAFGDVAYPYGVDDDISVWSNNGSLSFSRATIALTENSVAPFCVSSADINNDGYTDIIGAAFVGDYLNGNVGGISWWENNGDGTFGPENLLITDFSRARSAFGADIDGDGDTDILGAADQDNIIIWLENNGNQSFSADTITNTFSQVYFAYPKDMDGDGDMDVVGSAQDAYEVSWWENKQDEDSLIAAGDAPSVDFWGGNLIIDFSSGESDSVTVFYNAGLTPIRNSINTAEIHHIALKGYYTITTKKTTYSASAEFYYGSGNIEEWTNITNENDLLICFWNENNSRWEKAGASQTIDAVNNKITVNGISSEFAPFSKWTIGSISSDNPLPVELIYFSSNDLKGAIELKWETSQEINSIGYEIIRMNDDSSLTIASYQTDSSLISRNRPAEYRYVDAHVRFNINYKYQLWQIDVSGFRKKIAEITAATINNHLAKLSDNLPKKITLNNSYPNPFNSAAKLIFLIPDEAKRIVLTIFDISGKRVKTLINGMISPGQYSVLWDAKNDFGISVSSGVYIAVLTDGRNISTKRLILQK